MSTRQKFIVLSVMFIAMAGAFVYTAGSNAGNTGSVMAQEATKQYKCTACGQVFTYGSTQIVPAKCPSCGKGTLYPM